MKKRKKEERIIELQNEWLGLNARARNLFIDWYLMPGGKKNKEMAKKANDEYLACIRQRSQVADQIKALDPDWDVWQADRTQFELLMGGPKEWPERRPEGFSGE